MEVFGYLRPKELVVVGTNSFGPNFSLSTLEIRVTVSLVALVCKEFNNLSKDDFLWRRMYKLRWKGKEELNVRRPHF